MPKAYPEWNQLAIEEDSLNPFSTKYVFEDGSSFYIEPVFYTMLQGFKNLHPEHFQLILDDIERIVKNNRKVVFTGEFEHPLTIVDNDYIVLEIFDITDRLQLFVEDKSRGSDYGD